MLPEHVPDSLTAASHAGLNSKACVQVLSKALEVWGLTCENLMSEDNRESAAHPERETAFICNLKVAWQPAFRSARDCSTCCAERLLPALQSSVGST